VLVGGEIVTLFAAFPAIGKIFRRDRRMRVRLAGLFVITLLGVVSVLGIVVWVLAMFLGVGTLWRTFRVKPFFGVRPRRRPLSNSKQTSGYIAL
jgi:hypothetical protein